MTDRVGEIEQLLDEALALAWTEGKTGSYQAEAEAGKQKALAQVRALAAECERMRTVFDAAREVAYSRDFIGGEDEEIVSRLDEGALDVLERAVVAYDRAYRFPDLATPALPAATSEEGTSDE